jgi:hypothetical protein
MKNVKVLFSILWGASIVFLATSAWTAESKQAVKSQSSDMKPTQVASDTNKDGKPDRWEKYENGVIVSVEADANFDGVVDERGYFEGEKLVKVEKDSDFDGKPDRWINY